MDKEDKNIIERETINLQENQITSELFRLKLLTDETIQRIYENWLRITWDPNANKGEGSYVNVPGQQPLINAKGAIDCLTPIIDIVNKENMQAYLEEEYVEKTAVEIASNIKNLLFLNHKEYNLKDTVSGDIIVDDCLTIIYGTLSRAIKGRERKELTAGGTSEVREVLTPGLPHKKNLLGGLFGGNK